ncbi:MAG: lysophospholipid acyltransferase family protein [Pseudomonadota bacterium]
MLDATTVSPTEWLFDSIDRREFLSKTPLTHRFGNLLLSVAFRVHRLSSHLPTAMLRGLGVLVGRVTLMLATTRRDIARSNIDKCYPNLSAIERDRLLRSHFAALGVGIGELGLAWYARETRLIRLTDAENLEALGQAKGRRNGIILLCGHFTTLDLANRLLGLYIDHASVWRPLGNPIADHWIRRGRQAGAVELIEKTAFKRAIQWLRDGRALLVAADQADSSDGAVDAPFFGHTVTTNVTAWRLAQSTGCSVVPVIAGRESNGRYRLVFAAPLDDLAAQDAASAAALLNATIEAQIGRYPDQYYWVHRRFKRPNNDE